MPKVIRSMLVDGGKPMIGSESKMLGVRIAPNPQLDISVDADGNVHPGTGGLSVAPDWRKLPSFLIPKRLKSHMPDACGSNKLNIWSLGEGAFEVGALTENLGFRPDPEDPLTHGYIEPDRSMAVNDLQRALADTRDQWIKVEVRP